MILPPDDGCRNKLSRKSRAKAVARGQGKKTRKQRNRKQKPQPAANNSKKPEETPKMARRGGLPIATAAGIDQLEQVNWNAAGIDLGATVHFVAVPPGRDPETHVRCFQTFTADLQALADCLEQCGIETVAMESTGIYWIPLYDLLEQRSPMR
jgi:transposase